MDRTDNKGFILMLCIRMGYFKIDHYAATQHKSIIIRSTRLIRVPIGDII
jgi:hypothetical protein